MNEEVNETSFQPGKLREIVLSAFGVSLLVGGSIVFPTLPIVVGSILGLIEESHKKNIPPHKVKRVLANLEKRELIRLEERGDEIYVEISEKGTQEILKYSLEAVLNIKKRKKEWNGKWYMVLFDVPEVQKNKREHLRRFLKRIGFFPYQKSVYVFPYECEKEVRLIKQMVESSAYLSYIIADKIEHEKEVKLYFNL
ncbi:MAG: hypothetical protein Q7S61_03235 [bacterium]|nr:hypothetical protein [bacterium]